MAVNVYLEVVVSIQISLQPIKRHTIQEYHLFFEFYSNSSIDKIEKIWYNRKQR